MISIGIIGGSGYTGKKLLEYCSYHPFVSDFKVYGNSTAGSSIFTVFPELARIIDDFKIESVKNTSDEHDLYFIALPHGEALNYVPALIEKGKKVIDLGGDYRLDDANVYEMWYKLAHNSANLLNKKLYGLADYPGTDYSGVQLIANPGCYPTATLLGILPLLNLGNNEIIVAGTAAYSGTSGAGKTAKSEMLMSEMHGNVRAYNVNNHRHQPEILQVMNKLGFTAPFAFTTHLLPVSNGIYATTTVHLKNSVNEEEINSIYNNIYSNSYFVRMRPVPPNLNWVTGTNFCDINVSAKDKTIVITSTIDNLIKGASGQAVQNMNRLYNWDEKLGLISNKGEKNVSVY
ncbi:MAG: N-acetyl-gamma-glutamyl-phosphate reductase [Ignavibacteria bacterium]